MKTLITLIIGILIGLYLGTNYGIKLGKDLSIATIEKTFTQSQILSGKVNTKSGLNLDQINEIIKQKIEESKQQIIANIKQQTKNYLKQKIDEMIK